MHFGLAGRSMLLKRYIFCRSIPDQTKHVSELNRKIQTLERENRRLRDENRKAHEQAQAAVLQLRKFTEWFFKNVKRQ